MTRTKSQNGRRSRAKGAQWERDVVLRFRPIFADAERLGWQQRKVKGDGTPMPDVRAGHLWIECKVGARPPIVKGLAQAIEDMPKGQGIVPVCVAKQDRQAPTVTLLLADFVDMMKEWKERGQ